MAAVPYPHKARKPRNPRFVVLAAGTELVRIYNPPPHDTKAVTFRRFGPLERFDHHRFGPPRSDVEHGVWYGGFEFSTSLVEVFGDKGLVEYEERRVGIVTLTREVTLLDLVDGAMAASTVAAIASVTSRRLSQSWSRHFYRRTGLFGKVDGLYYNGAHNAGKCVVLYERAETAVQCDEKTTSLLSDRRWRPEILSAIQRYNLTE